MREHESTLLLEDIVQVLTDQRYLGTYTITALCVPRYAHIQIPMLKKNKKIKKALRYITKFEAPIITTQTPRYAKTPTVPS